MTGRNEPTQLHYLDSSVVLGYLLEGRDDLRRLTGERNVASSRLLWTEVSRAIHRALQTQRLTPNEATAVRRAFQTLIAGVSQIGLADAVLQRADGPYPIVIRTLDAIHLASAELWLRELDAGLPYHAVAMWTLDERMNQCAVQLGFETPLI